jgi:type IV fimbrial biogenesis protein FimT
MQRDRFETPMMPSPNSKIRRLRPSGGFTLVELLIGLAIAGMLISLATPHWRSLIAAAELRERALALVGAMSVARSEAIKRGTRVDLCPSADRTRCAGAFGWDAGWLAYANEPATDQPAVGSLVTRTERAAPDGVTIRGNRPVADYVSFTGLGHARRHDGALQMGTFTVCRPGQDALKVVLANSGRARIDTTREACP